MASPDRAAQISFARQMVSALRTALLEAAANGGAVSVSFDGQSTTWNHSAARAELVAWEKKLHRLQHGRVRTINLDGAG
jgi:hypothetical protein